jgi:FtsH-binding integral membrane protein
MAATFALQSVGGDSRKKSSKSPQGCVRKKLCYWGISDEEDPVLRERALKVMLVLVGLLFLAGAYLIVRPPFKDETFRMMLSLYVTLGVFLLLAVRNPVQHRSLIAFAAWSSLAHAGIMGFQVFRNLISANELPGVIALAIIGIVLIVLAPPKVKLAAC